MSKPEPWYESGVLKPDVHHRLVADMDRVAQEAGIQKQWLWTRLSETLSPAEIVWWRRFHFHAAQGKAGLIYHGRGYKPKVETRCFALAGALVRNFVHARVMTATQVLDAARAGSSPRHTCLLITNFFSERQVTAEQAHWRAGVLHDLLLARQALGLQTVIHVTHMPTLEKEYGASLHEHLQGTYHLLNPGDVA